MTTASDTPQSPESGPITVPDSWRDPTPDGQTLAMVDFPGVLLVGATTLIQRHLTRPALEPHELGVPEWRLLAFLHENGRSVAGEIASRTWMDKAQISRVLDALVARGLARREADPQHRQRLLVELTAKGRKVHALAFEATRRKQSELLAALTLSERKGLYTALKKLQAFAEAAGAGLPDEDEAPAPKGRRRKSAA
ncbi:MarR family winged helix-turn-helix transcriptional regulator [Mitsuaria sp. GD03876]|uniref:MarR family winged helix-turn-helix transcriptional regulator n=1 Tax=Mitsuaria sp. GD03876 TaxID=2975399 RepID=UPI00244B196D|nr:MarR family winged helix-turn-helix transcriptional regulator [Mitsuaria sp. GD03876]MDH0867347.1 MarR family winged helix-turn-helix transcriptional regulator [Mitsuaria sp. GD03876]